MSPRAPAIRLKTLESFFHPSPSLILRRHVHSTRPHSTIAAAPPSTTIPISPHRPLNAKDTCLHVLPTSSVLRTFIITAMTSNPVTLKACFAILKKMLDSKSILMNPERNLILRWMFKHTFYAQYCAGETKAEIARTAAALKSMGYTGMVLEYALEVLECDRPSQGETAKEIEVFRKGMSDAIDVAEKGDFLALKWSGLGRESLYLLQEDQEPTPAMLSCIHEICDAAVAKGALFLPGAEEESMNPGLDRWTLALQRKYNKEKAFMFHTYQAYLKSTPAKLAQHIVKAGKEGYIPGIKLVRGAYMASEPTSAIWSSWEETSKYYDGIVEALLTRKWNSILKSPSGDNNAPFPEISLMIASHNAQTIQRAQIIRNQQVQKGERRIELCYAQLQGMADEISCELLQASKSDAQGLDKPRAYKAATWGTLEECMNFLVRRASENQDAAGRTIETRRAMGRELTRRFRGAFGLT